MNRSPFNLQANPFTSLIALGQIPFKESTIVGVSIFKSTVNKALAIRGFGNFNFPRTISTLFAFSADIRETNIGPAGFEDSADSILRKKID